MNQTNQQTIEPARTIDPSIKKKHSFELLNQLNFESEVKDGSANLDKYIYDRSPSQPLKSLYNQA